jgi:hypothetical protein
MKRIYLLMIVMVVAVSNAMAQRAVDLSVKGYYSQGTTNTWQAISNGMRFLFDGGGGTNPATAINFGWEATNHAANVNDSVMAGDSVHVLRYFANTSGAWGFSSGYATTMNLKGGGATSGVYSPTSGWPKAVSPDDNNLDNIFNGASGSESLTWCDTIWINAGPTTMANPPVETVLNNNESCATITANGWATGVNEIGVDIKENGLIVYPNPSVARDINVMYNFGSNTSKATVTIVDVAGKVVYNQVIGTNLTGVKVIALNIPSIAPGMYSLRLATDNATATEKIYVN